MNMKIKSYQKWADRTAPNANDDRARITKWFATTDPKLLQGVFGLVKETGELYDMLSRAAFYNKNSGCIDYENVEEELGDILWYIAEICNACRLDLETIMADNIAKLQARFPEKFSGKDAEARADKASAICDALNGGLKPH